MKNFQVTKKHKEDFAGVMAQEDDYDVLLDEDVIVTREDGSILCILIKKGLSKENAVKAWTALAKDDFTTLNRGTATGVEKIVEGKQHQVRRVDAVQSGIIGFFERTARMPYCRACAWNLNNPEKMELLNPMVVEVDALLKKHAPERYEKQAAVARKSHPDFLIAGTTFSTLTVNKNFRTAYHKDAGNIADGISCMTVIRQGKWTGANLVFPAYRVAVKLDSMDLIIFDPHEFHGNTELYKLSKDAVRCSIVFYFREKIQECLSASEELDKVKNRKQGEQLFKIKVRKKKDVESGTGDA